jgi:hypothetical protein
MFEIELAFSANDYERDLCEQGRLYTDQMLPGLEPSTRKIRIFRTSFGAAFALATAAFWFTMVTDPPRTEAAPPQVPIGDQIIDPPELDAHCKNFISTCPEDGGKWGGEPSHGRG